MAITAIEAAQALTNACAIDNQEGADWAALKLDEAMVDLPMEAMDEAAELLSEEALEHFAYWQSRRAEKLL